MNGFYWIYLVMMVFLLGYEFSRNKETKQRIYYSACGFLLMLFVLQDYSVSCDTPEYMRQWNIISDLNFSGMLAHKFEIGFVLLCHVLERVFVSDRVLLLVLGVLILIPLFRFYEDDTDNPMITLMAWASVSSPALTKLTTITVVALDDWITVVIPRPVATPLNGLEVMAERKLRSLSPAAF